MSDPRPSVLALVGPTASGKTGLALELAAALDAEIVNADSRQVFRGLDIGSAKPSAAEQRAVAHHVIDVVDPDESFHAAAYHRLAIAAIKAIHRRGRRALVVGGTGLYVKVLRGGLFAGPARDPALRAQLEAEEQAVPGSLHRRLTAVDPESAARLHPNDAIRLVRALEVFTATGRSIAELQREHGFGARPYRFHSIALDVPREDLNRRIELRCRAMLDAGFLDEVRHLLGAGYGPDLPALRSVGYREMVAHVRGELSLAEALDRMARATRQLAKRQRTWFRNDPETEWLPPELPHVLRAARTASFGGEAPPRPSRPHRRPDS